MEKISYLDAKAQGLKTYFTGVPCKRGHVCERFVANCSCRECQYEVTRIWGKKNPDLKRKFYQDWIIRHPDYNERWAKDNPDAVRKIKRRWYLKDPKRRIKVALEWASKHIENRRTNTRNRIARIKSANGTHTVKEVLQMLRAQNWKCAACGISIRKKRHIDHIMPLNLGGSNCISNLQGLCPTCNCSKNAKDPFVWAHELGIKLNYRRS